MLTIAVQKYIDDAVSKLHQEPSGSGIHLRITGDILSVTEAISAWAVATGNKAWLASEHARADTPVQSRKSDILEWWRVERHDPNVYVADHYHVPLDKN
jgi:hypothetical protein